MTYPTIIIASITGVGGFAVLSPGGTSGPTSASTQFTIVLVQYVFASLNVLSGMLTSISKFSNNAQRSEEHSVMAVRFGEYYRNIDMELSLARKDRVPVLEFVKKCRDEYDKLLKESPDIPQESILAYNKEFPNAINKPDVCNGLSSISHLPGDNETPTLKSEHSLHRSPFSQNSLGKSFDRMRSQL